MTLTTSFQLRPEFPQNLAVGYCRCLNWGVGAGAPCKKLQQWCRANQESSSFTSEEQRVMTLILTANIGSKVPRTGPKKVLDWANTGQADLENVDPVLTREAVAWMTVKSV